MLSEYFGDTLSEGRQELYWQAIQPKLSLEEWEFACAQAIQRETFHKVPLVATLLAYAAEYRQQRYAQAQQAAEKLLPQWSSMPDEVGVAAIREVLRMLGDGMAMPKHPAYAAPSEESPEERKARLLEQALKVEALTPHNGKA